jgi:hypothetical protein
MTNHYTIDTVTLSFERMDDHVLLEFAQAGNTYTYSLYWDADIDDGALIYGGYHEGVFGFDGSVGCDLGVSRAHLAEAIEECVRDFDELVDDEECDCSSLHEFSGFKCNPCLIPLMDAVTAMDVKEGGEDE